MSGFDLAVLFWIYKDAKVCVNRASWLRKKNPGTSIYCLYGGPPEDAARFEAELRGLVDDFYVFPLAWTAEEKWTKGDQLITSWYRARGKDLAWDTIFVAQWDLAIFSPVRDICGDLGAGQLLLPALRPIWQTQPTWWWVRPNSPQLADFHAFEDVLQGRALSVDEPVCCSFLAAALPRDFLARYAAEAPDVGFLEYKIPMLAKVWGYTFCTTHSFEATRQRAGKYSLRERLWNRFTVTMHIQKRPILTVVVYANRLWPTGKRVFHPYGKVIPF